MKFASIISSALTLGSVFAAPASQTNKAQVSQNNVPGGIAYPTKFNLHEYINADAIHSTVQDISKIPKEKFVSKVNKVIDYAQDVVDVSIALENIFEDKIKSLTPAQLEKLSKLWTKATAELSKAPADLHKLEAELVHELFELAVILFELEELEKLFHLEALFKL